MGATKLQPTLSEIKVSKCTFYRYWGVAIKGWVFLFFFTCESSCGNYN